MIVTRTELADVLGITPAKISTLVSNSVFTSTARGKYDLKECVQKYIEYSVEHVIKDISKQRPQEDATESLNYWKMVRQKTAALKELGITMRLEDAEHLMSTRLEQIRNVLTSIDSVWAPYMVGLKTVEESQKMLSKQLDSLFEQLSTLQDFVLDDELPGTETEDEDDLADE